MPEFVSVLQGDKSKTVVTVTKEFAVGLGLDVLESEPAVDAAGRPLGPRQAAEPPSELKGAELDAALDAAGLPKTGSADEKRQRLADHNADQEV